MNSATSLWPSPRAADRGCDVVTDPHQPDSRHPSAVTPASLPGKQDAEGWRTLHPLTPILRGGLFIIVILGILIANLRDQVLNFFFGRFGFGSDIEFGNGEIPEEAFESNEVPPDWELNFEETGIVPAGWEWIVFLGAAVLVLAIIGFALWLDWRMKTFRVTDEAVEARSGVLFRKHRRAPLDRVQGVNLQRPLLARITGLTMLEIATAGSDGKVQLTYLAHADAKEIRAIILRGVARKRGRDVVQPLPGPVTSAEPLPEGEPAPSTPGAAASQELSRRLDEFADLDLDPQGADGPSAVVIPVPRLIGSTLLSWETLIPLVMFVAVLFFGFTGTSWAFFTIIPLLVVAVGTWFSSFTKGMNFHISHSDQGVRVASGLLSTVTDTIPESRIHAVEVRQPIFWRPMGWWQIRITTAGLKLTEAGQSGAKNIMLPVGKLDDVRRVLDLIVPDHGLDGAEFTDALIGTAGPYLRSPNRATPVLLWGRRRNGLRLLTSHDTATPALVMRKGWLTRKLLIVPLERFQSIELTRGPMHLPLRLAALQCHTVLGPVTLKISGLDLDDAREAFDTVQGAVLTEQLSRSAS